MIEFRWVALIALWTLLSGPVFSAPVAPPPVNPVAVVAIPAK